jgi:hypothetical protein
MIANLTTVQISEAVSSRLQAGESLPKAIE